ncbi:MAG: hypothetical protein DMD89_22735 [Candidatus Rokuibacteriota bacterium]|nr:MAG: hypothetical protein DMD89_22735 [Candidatus Rokubacteria bacterium]
MRRTAVSLVLAAALVLVGSLPSDAARRGHHGGRRHFGGGTHIFIRVLPGYSYPYWWDYPAAYYYYAPPIVVQEPPVYIQQQSAPTAPASQEVPWYYCASTHAYYPWVRSCNEAWIEIPARPK